MEERRVPVYHHRTAALGVAVLEPKCREQAALTPADAATCGDEVLPSDTQLKTATALCAHLHDSCDAGLDRLFLRGQLGEPVAFMLAGGIKLCLAGRDRRAVLAHHVLQPRLVSDLRGFQPLLQPLLFLL